MIYRNDPIPSVTNPLVQASRLLAPVAVVRQDSRPALIAAAAFAMSGMTLAFIMLMGVGYEMNDAPQTIGAAQVSSTLMQPAINGQGVHDAIPIRDEEGALIAPKP